MGRRLSGWTSSSLSRVPLPGDHDYVPVDFDHRPVVAGTWFSWPCLQNLQNASLKGRVRPRPRIEAPHLIGQLWRGSTPVDTPVFLLEKWGQRCLGVVLGGWTEGPRGEALNSLDEQFGSESGQAGLEFTRCFFRSDARPSTEEHRAGVQPLVDQHGRDTRLRVPARDGPLYRRGAAKTGEQRSMNVDRAEGRDVDHAPGEDLPIGDDHLQFGLESAQLVLGPGLANAARLEDAHPARDGHRLQGRRSEGFSPALLAVGLGDEGGDLVAGVEQGLEGGDREGPAPEEHDAQEGATPPPSRPA